MDKTAIIMPIVIPTDFHFKMTETAIYNIQRFTPPELYQLVVVHGAQEEYGKYIKKMLRDEDLYIGFNKNVCQPVCLNLGIKKTDTKYICIFSNDVFVHQNWLEPLIEVLKNTEYNIVGSFWQQFPYKSKETEEDIRKVGNFRSIGMNAAVMTRETFEKIGEFDERLVQVFWDQDYNMRIEKLGLKMAHIFNSKITSIGSATHLQTEDKEISKFWNIETQQEEAKIFKEKYGEI